MSAFNADQTSAGQLRWSVVDALRRYGTDSSRVGHAFAAQHHLRPADLQALVAIMSAEGAGSPMTPGRLRDHLKLSAGGTSYVIDRLVEAGHIERHRDHPSDSRVVHLRYTPQGQAMALQFFGPLGAATAKVMDQFTDDELAVINRFIQAAAEAMSQHLERLDADAGLTDPGKPDPAGSSASAGDQRRR